MKTSELIGPYLDWAVAKCEGLKYVAGNYYMPNGIDYFLYYSPSNDWSLAGPIIEQGSVGISPCEDMETWSAWLQFRQGMETYYGQTPLIAAMRCYVASKLGDEVNVPEEL